MSHLTNDELELYTLHHASPALVERVEEHLLLCDKCRGSLTYLDKQIALMRELLSQFADQDATVRPLLQGQMQKKKAAVAH